MIDPFAFRKPILYLIVLPLMLSLPHCAEEEINPPAGQGWTSADPAAIPVRQRILQAERGNLVRNPSFELGRLINLDSSTVSYNITGWKVMGDHVTWINHPPDSTGSSREIRSGFHAIKIKREKFPGLNDAGKGIVSDFIRVIPGTYELTFWIRLLDMKPRIETSRMNDAIDIQLLFYDKNRLLISGITSNPLRGTIINQSFKGLPFASFWYIDSLDWVSIRGKSSHDFLTRDEIPDEAKFVKLYFGLKGTGTMWLDDVDFRYSKRNFTALERDQKMFDSAYTELDLLVPQPRQAEAGHPVIYHVPGNDSIPFPLIVIPQIADKRTRAAANLIKEKLESRFARLSGAENLADIRIVTYPATEEIERGGLVFNIGQGLSGKEKKKLGPQGYLIHPDSLNHNLVHLSGVSSIGNYYAAATAVQLLDDSLFIYHQSTISDYPEIQERAFLFSPVAAAANQIDYTPFLEEMAELKFNWAYLDFYRSRTLWKQESSAYFKGLQVIGEENRVSELLNLAQMVNPYAFFPFMPKLDSLDNETMERWSHADYSSRIKLFNYFTAGIKAGISTMVLCTNDYLPESSHGDYVLFSSRDRQEYINLQAAHLDLIWKLFSWSREKQPEVGIEFMPPWFSNEDIDRSRGQAEQYFHDLSGKLPASMRMLWSGPSRQSISIDMANYKRFHDLASQDLVLADNSMNIISRILEDTSNWMYKPMKIRTLSLFEPFSAEFLEPFSLPGGNGKMLINSAVSSEIMKIRIATAADFMWNPESYDPDISIGKILISRFGNAAAIELLHFNDSYFSALASIAALQKDMDKQRLFRVIDEKMKYMGHSIQILNALIPGNPGLLNELKSLKQSIQSKSEEEAHAIAGQIIASLDSI